MPDTAAARTDAEGAQPFLDLEPTSDPLRWRLQVPLDRCVGMPGAEFLFGGAGLGLAITALQRSAERPAIWATSQYTAYARPGETLEVSVDLVNVGKSVTQARAVARVGEREIFAVSAALGSRPGDLSRQWLKAPEATAPTALQPAPHYRGMSEGLHAHLDVRVVHGRRSFAEIVDTPSQDGRLITWVRPMGGQPIDLGFLAVVGDMVPSGVGNAVGFNAGGNSLDNTLRINRLVPTDWILSDVQIQAVERGFVQGAAHLFSQDGVLLATANQTMILRRHQLPPEPDDQT